MVNAKVRENALAWAMAAGIGIPASLPATAQEVMHDDQIFVFLQAEEIEYRSGDGEDSYNWDAQGWVGEDFNKLWFKTEGWRRPGCASCAASRCSACRSCT
jgi:copper resistance protein B